MAVPGKQLSCLPPSPGVSGYKICMNSATGSQRRDCSEEDMLQIEWRINGDD